MSNHTFINTIIFDWDGTLADSSSLGLMAFQKSFAELGLVFDVDTYETTYSPNWHSTYEALALPREKWEEADRLWLLHYGEQVAALIEGVAETLQDLHRRNYRLGIVTSGSESRVCREIARSQLQGVFDAIICNEHIIKKKPHPEGLELALQRLQCDSMAAAYVGDAPEDIEMGKALNVLTIGVRSNYPSSTRLLNSSPDIYLERMPELLDHF